MAEGVGISDSMQMCSLSLAAALRLTVANHVLIILLLDISSADCGWMV
jgi:hypothetical protein